MARDERKLLEEIALDIAKSAYDYRNDLSAYMDALAMVEGLDDMALVDYVCK